MTTEETEYQEPKFFTCSCKERMPLRTIDVAHVCDGVLYTSRIRAHVCPNYKEADHDTAKLGEDAHTTALYNWDAMKRMEEDRVDALVKACIPGASSVVWLRKSLYHPDDQRPEDEGLQRYWSYERFSQATGVYPERLKSWEKHRKIEHSPPTLDERIAILAVWHANHPRGRKPTPTHEELRAEIEAVDAVRQSQPKPVEKFVVIE